MLETFTPAVCGSRHRQIVAQALFSVAAVVTAAALGLALGLVGSVLGGRRAVLVAAALALLAAAREAGLVRFPLPQLRRQVPERWRFELPLPVWATGYGAGLGAGLFTFQPVATFWVACAAAVALARPVPAALCLSLYGAGRALTVVWPRRADSDPTAAVERLAGRRGALLRANVVALVAAGVLLALAPSAGAAARVAVAGALDPSVSGGALAYATQDGTVVVRPKSGPEVVVPDASQPALSGQYLAYVPAGGGIRVVRWTDPDLTEVARIANASATRPGLDWPTLAFVRRDASVKRLIVRNLQTGAYRARFSIGAAGDLGRPSVRGGRVAWHATTKDRSRIMVLNLASGRRHAYLTSRIRLLQNPSLSRKVIVWVDASSGKTHVRQGWIGHRSKRNVVTVKSRTVSYWTTSLGATSVYWTQWRLPSGAADIRERSL